MFKKEFHKMKFSIALLVLLASSVFGDTYSNTNNPDGFSSSPLASESPKMIAQPKKKENDVEFQQIPVELEPPNGPVVGYSNSINFQEDNASSEETDAAEANFNPNPIIPNRPSKGDMEAAETITIGRHSGRFFGPGLWIGSPVRPSRPTYRYRRPFFHSPRRYHGGYNNQWIPPYYG